MASMSNTGETNKNFRKYGHEAFPDGDEPTMAETENEDILPILIQNGNKGQTLSRNEKQNRKCDLSTHNCILLMIEILAVVAIVIAVGTIQRKQLEDESITQEERTDNICLNQFTGGETTWQNFMQSARELNGTDRCDAGHHPLRCSCANYSIPAVPNEDAGKHNAWLKTFADNLQRIQDYVDSGEPPLDVVMLGDSITAHWLATSLYGVDKRYQDIVPVYERLFRPENASDISGFALGIGGDQCPNLLYRIENGEMNDALQPSVWWVLIGTNDVGGGFCKDEIVISGIILIAETIRKRRPNATVVINSILPRGTEKNMGAWNHLSKINHAVECYADGHDRIEFFNASSLFLQSDDATLNSSLFQDGLHPNAEGAAIWGAAIVEKVKQIIERNQT